MFRHLLVPLDGSRLAESVMPAAASLASALGARVTLIHVIEPNPPRAVHGDRHLRDGGEAEAYLAEIARDRLPAGVTVERHVHIAGIQNVAAGIVQHVEEFGSDLTIMCSHGRTGLRDWLFGSIAQQVVNLGASPVLIIPAAGEPQDPTCRFRRLLVTLDGNPAHEQGLNVAADLARDLKASLHLLQVVPTYGALAGKGRVPSRLLPGTTSRLLDLSVAGAEDYLRRLQERAQAGGVEVTWEVARGEPPQLISKAGRHASIDMIVLGTHGKTGADAFWSGSVTARVCRNCQTPLLLVPVPQEGGPVSAEDHREL